MTKREQLRLEMRLAHCLAEIAEHHGGGPCDPWDEAWAWWWATDEDVPAEDFGGVVVAEDWGDMAIVDALLTGAFGMRRVGVRSAP